MDKVKDKVMNTKILAVIGIACMILGTFFAYITFWGLSISLLKYWEGYVIIIMAIANALIIFQTYAEKYMPKIFRGKFGQFLASIENQKVSLIPTAIVAILVIYLHTTVKSSYISYGFGFYLELIGIISLVAYPFVYKGEAISTEINNNEVE